MNGFPIGSFGAFVGMLLYVILSCIHFPLACALRHEMGERYCGRGKFMVSVFLFGFFSYGGSSGLRLFHFSGNLVKSAEEWGWLISSLSFVLFVMVFLLNRIEINERNKKGIRWHSRFVGKPRFLPCTRNVQKNGLMGVGLILAVAFFPFHAGLAIYAVAQALCLGLEWQWSETAARNRFLDAVDKSIEGKELARSFRGEPVTATQGFMLPLRVTDAERQRDGEDNIMRMYAALDPKLQGMIEKKPGREY